MTTETEAERTSRHHRRSLFNGVAQLYDATRLAYPDEIIEFIATTAAVDEVSRVLEIGCGTGQLTASLAGFGANLTAIDIGPSMVATARRRLDNPAISWRVTSFEGFVAADGAFDLIVSGTAFHWIDPEIGFDKSARLLRPNGWLALLSTTENYDGPFGTALQGMWTSRSDDGVWRSEPDVAEMIAVTGLFDPPVRRTHHQPITLPADTVIGLENTRATALSWPENVRREFTEELRHQLRRQTEVRLIRQTDLTMARVAAGN